VEAFFHLLRTLKKTPVDLTTLNLAKYYFFGGGKASVVCSIPFGALPPTLCEMAK
jgi:hypothetical protein